MTRTNAVAIDPFFNALLQVATEHGADYASVRKALDLAATVADLAYNYAIDDLEV